MSYVVTLTGGKNNAGDFLIKQKAHALINNLRPDLEIVDLNGWDVNEDDLQIINGASILLLTGGPALIPNMVPAVYSLSEILEKITIPIATFGIGWFHANGDWQDTSSFSFNQPTLALFKRIAANGFINSVRDHFTLEVLYSQGVHNVVMTGCPVLYNGGNVVSEIKLPTKVSTKVAISMGVGFKDMRSLFIQTKNLVVCAGEKFHDITVVFHHSLEKHKYVAASLTKKQNELIRLLNDKGIKYIDASGSAGALINAYDQFDVHFGYRVHAHLYMLSQGKPSYIISEDGRGTGQQQVLGEPSFRSYIYSLNSKILRGVHRLGFSVPTKIIDKDMASKFLTYVESDSRNGFIKSKNSVECIKSRFPVMKKFVEGLPR
jgi:hypothetical protein